jgi:hypothetical protein
MSTGFGTKYSDPGTLATGNADCVSAAQSAASVAIVSDTSPGVLVYNWSSSGFGSKVADPATLPGIPGNRLKFY